MHGHSLNTQISQINDVLRDILLEKRKTIPKEPCSIQLFPGSLSATGQIGATNAARPRLTVRFTYRQQFVKSIYTIVSNNTSGPIGFSINEPYSAAAASATRGNGIAVAAGKFVVIEHVEVQMLTLHITAATFVPVNSLPIGATGAVWIYGWTIPEMGYITE